MRLWSVHPRYLDARGLVAVWREALLAKKVLEGKTTGYRRHPQLERFLAVEHPLDGINSYLTEIYKESVRRGYHFDHGKISEGYQTVKIPVTRGQLEYETAHLLSKLQVRDLERYAMWKGVKEMEASPVFCTVEGGVEEWERSGEKKM